MTLGKSSIKQNSICRKLTVFVFAVLLLQSFKYIEQIKLKIMLLKKILMYSLKTLKYIA